MLDPTLVGFAFSAGVLTFFAPCAYPLLPGYVSFYLGRSVGDEAASTGPGPSRSEMEPDGGTVTVTRRTRGSLPEAVGIGIVVSVGFFVVYALLAGIVVALGARALENISVLELVVGVLLVGLGTAMVVGWKPNVNVPLPERRRGPAAFFGFGVVYAAAAAGCTAPLFVAVSLRAVSAGPTSALAVFGAYAAGMSVLMVAVTVLTALGQGVVLRRVTGRIDLLYRAAGVVLVIAGLVQAYFFLFRFDGLSLLGF